MGAAISDPSEEDCTAGDNGASQQSAAKAL